MQVAVAAYPIDWHNRWNEYVGKLRLWVRAAAEGGADLLVFPEFAALEIATLAEAQNAAEPARATDALTARLKDVDVLHASLAREFGVHILAASGPVRRRDGSVVNRARLFAPGGGRGVQDQAGPDEERRTVWGLAPGGVLRVFDTALGRIGVLVGADIAAPKLVASLAGGGAALLLAPSCTGSPEAAAARADAARAASGASGLPVALAVALGDAGWCAALGRSTGAAAVYGPQGVLAEGRPDAPGWIHAVLPEPAAAELRAEAEAEALPLGVERAELE